MRKHELLRTTLAAATSATLATAAIYACGSGAGEVGQMLIDAGTRMMDAGDVLLHDAGAQVPTQANIFTVVVTDDQLDTLNVPTVPCDGGQNLPIVVDGPAVITFVSELDSLEAVDKRTNVCVRLRVATDAPDTMMDGQLYIDQNHALVLRPGDEIAIGGIRL